VANTAHTAACAASVHAGFSGMMASVAAEAAPAIAAAARGGWATAAAVGMGAGIAVAPLLITRLPARPRPFRLAATAALSLYLLPLSALVVLLAATAVMAVAQVGFLLGDLAAARRDNGSGAAFSGASATWYLTSAPATAVAAAHMPAEWLLAVAVLAVLVLPLSAVRSALDPKPRR
jgi:hypothetical protein